jgi:hypothetical protein
MAVKITAPYVNDKLEEHIIKHNDVYWPMLKKHDELLVGPKGDDGICFDVREIVNGFKTIKNLGYAVITAIVIDTVTRLMSLPK